MATPAPNPYGLICDPGPCDPWKIDLFARDFEAWQLLLVIVAAFVAGLRTNRSSWGLPLAAMALIAALVHLQIAGEYRMLRLHLTDLAGPGGNLSAADFRSLDEFWSHKVELAFVGFAAFALLPFALGLTVTFLRRAQRRAQARPANA